LKRGHYFFSSAEVGGKMLGVTVFKFDHRSHGFDKPALKQSARKPNDRLASVRLLDAIADTMEIVALEGPDLVVLAGPFDFSRSSSM
jgi:hypothetical protein